MIRVLALAGLCLVQDHGRPGFASLGVSPSGAFDAGAADLANRLVGNDERAAVVEVLGGGVTLRTDAPALLAVTGARGPLLAQGRPAPRNTGLQVAAGGELTVAPPTGGLRSYVAVRGGFAVPAVLGSRSRDVLGGLGPAPLRVSDVLPVGPAHHPAPGVAHAPVGALGPAVLTVSPGPRRDWFDADAWRLLTTAGWRVGADSNRVGVRLQGPPIARAAAVRARELPPEPLVRGAIQVPPDGQPIVLGPDHPTTGGYPVIAVTDPAGTSRLAQAVPGEVVLLSSAGR